MEYRNLGRTGLKVSPLILGTMNFGRRVTEADAHTLMDHALDRGINMIDTADAYGGRPGEGYCEQVIGRWLAQGGGRRDKVVLATKLYRPMSDWPNNGRLSARYIRHACEASLRRLQTDHIDLYQMHHIDRNAPWDEVWQAMEQLVREGKAIYIGSSNFAGWHIAQAQEAAKSRHFLGLVSEQSLYNLAERAVELEALPACAQYGLGFLAWSPLSAGILGGTLRSAQPGRRAEPDQVKKIGQYHDQIERYKTLCQDLGEEPGQIALAWLLANPVVTAPIIGPRMIEHLASAIGALEIRLSVETLVSLNDIWPGPRSLFVVTGDFATASIMWEG